MVWLLIQSQASSSGLVVWKEHQQLAHLFRVFDQDFYPSYATLIDTIADLRLRRFATQTTILRRQPRFLARDIPALATYRRGSPEGVPRIELLLDLQ